MKAETRGALYKKIHTERNQSAQSKTETTEEVNQGVYFDVES